MVSGNEKANAELLSVTSKEFAALKCRTGDGEHPKSLGRPFHGRLTGFVPPKATSNRETVAPPRAFKPNDLHKNLMRKCNAALLSFGVQKG